MMLWYKNWLETRWGFVLGLGMWIAFGAFLLFSPNPARRPPEMPDYGFLILNSVITFMLLAGSGVRAHPGSYTEAFPTYQAIPFTLSLPVSRRRLLLVRAIIGIVEAVGLSFIVNGFILAFLGRSATLFDLTVPFFVMVIFGICLYCMATLLANIFNLGLYSILCWAVAVLMLMVATSDRAPAFMRILTPGGLPIGTRFAIPWIPIFFYLAISAILMFVTIRIVESRDY